ncbi:MAG TPA: WGxxGxxG family protein [Chthoniobacterales bacterium]|jgi:hypothetical protein
MKINKQYLLFAVAATVLSPLVASAQTSGGATGSDTVTTVEREDDRDYGWVGLLGLLGLAGLKRKNDDRHSTTAR